MSSGHRGARPRVVLQKLLSAEACSDPAVAVCSVFAAAAASVASAAAAARAFAAIAESVAGGVALLAAFSRHRLSVVLLAGLPGPAFAGASAVPVPVSRIAFLAAAGTSDLASRCLYLEDSDVRQEEGRVHGQAGWAEKRCSLDGCCSLDGRPDG